MLKKKFLVLLSCFCVTKCYSTSLEDVLYIYTINCPKAKLIRYKYENNRLEFENYKKSFLPSISFGFSPLSLNRNYKLLQDPISGQYSYVEDYSNSSSTDISISQKIGMTGGSISLSSSLGYLREFSINRNSFSSSPIYISYRQPLLGGYKQYKYNKSIMHMQHEYSLKDFCNSMSLEQNKVLDMYLNAYASKLQCEVIQQNLLTGDTLLYFAKIKLNNGLITKYEYNKIELQQLQSEQESTNKKRAYKEKILELCTELQIGEIDVESPKESELPVLLDSEKVLSLVHQNNPQYLNNEIQRKQAEYSRMQTINSLRFNGDVSLSYGMNQFGESLKTVYSHPGQRQSVSITLSFPVFQWGINNNKRKIANNDYETSIVTIEQSEKEFDNSIINKIDEYHAIYKSYLLSKKSFELLKEQYKLSVKRFGMGKISVYELTSDYKSLQTSMVDYSSSLKNLYSSYFALRHLALYDFIKDEKLENIYTRK